MEERLPWWGNWHYRQAHTHTPTQYATHNQSIHFFWRTPPFKIAYFIFCVVLWFTDISLYENTNWRAILETIRFYSSIRFIWIAQLKGEMCIKMTASQPMHSCVLCLCVFRIDLALCSMVGAWSENIQYSLSTWMELLHSFNFSLKCLHILMTCRIDWNQFSKWVSFKRLWSTVSLSFSPVTLLSKTIYAYLRMSHANIHWQSYDLNKFIHYYNHWICIVFNIHECFGGIDLRAQVVSIEIHKLFRFQHEQKFRLHHLLCFALRMPHCLAVFDRNTFKLWLILTALLSAVSTEEGTKEKTVTVGEACTHTPKYTQPHTRGFNRKMVRIADVIPMRISLIFNQK